MSEEASEYTLNIVELLNVTKPAGGGYNEHIRGILNWRDTYDINKTYYLNDIVEYNNTQYIRTDENTGNEIPTDINCWKSFAASNTQPIHFTFREHNNRAYIDTNSSTYLLAQKILFAGSDILGTLSSIKVIASITGSGKAGKVRIIDTTHGSIICENTNINTTSPAIFDLGSISNIPTGISDLQIQYSKGTANKILLYSATIIF